MTHPYPYGTICQIDHEMWSIARPVVMVMSHSVVYMEETNNASFTYFVAPVENHGNHSDYLHQDNLALLSPLEQLAAEADERPSLMYGIINKCFGVNLQLEEGEGISRTLAPFLRDLALFDLGEEEISEWGQDEVLEWASEVVGDMPFSWAAYSGSGSDPLAIGFGLHSWPYWELEGPKGVIAAAQNLDREYQTHLNKWVEHVPENIRNLLINHGLQPKIFWTTSTS